MNPELIGNRLTELRKNANKSRLQVAKDTGITISALSNYENGLRIPRDEAKQRIAGYYGVSIDELFYAS